MSKQLPNFYEFNHQKYSVCFPLEWATTHLESTGPNECKNCKIYGCDNDIFKQYCYNCQEYIYHGSRISKEYCQSSVNMYKYESNKTSFEDIQIEDKIDDIETTKNCVYCNIVLDYYRDGKFKIDNKCNNCYWEQSNALDWSKHMIFPDYRTFVNTITMQRNNSDTQFYFSEDDNEIQYSNYSPIDVNVNVGVNYDSY